MKISNSSAFSTNAATQASDGKEAKPAPKAADSTSAAPASNSNASKALQTSAQQNRAQLSLSGDLRQRDLQNTLSPQSQKLTDLARNVSDISAGARADLGVPSQTPEKGIDVNSYLNGGNNSVSADSYSKFQDSLSNHGKDILSQVGPPPSDGGKSAFSSTVDAAGQQLGQLQQGVRDNLTNAGYSSHLADQLFGKTHQNPQGSIGQTQDQGTGFGAADMPGFEAAPDPLQLKNPRLSQASDFIDDAKKAANDAWESAKKTAKEVLDHAAEKIIGPVRNNNEKEQLNQLEKQDTKSMPAPDGVTPDRTSAPVAPHNGPSGLADPPDEFGKPEADVAKFASKLAAGLMSKVNPNPNDEGKPAQGEPITLPTPGVVDPPDDPMGSRTPSPKPKTGPRPGIGPLPRMS